MNKIRRNNLKDMLKKLEAIKDDLSDLMYEESYAFESMPENLQCGMRGQDMEEGIDNMSDAIDNINEAIGLLDEVI